MFNEFAKASSSEEQVSVDGEEPAGEESKGAYLPDESDFDVSKLSYYVEKDKTIVTYNHNKRIYINSDTYVGELKVYESTLQNSGPCLYVKKSSVLERLKNQISKTLGKDVRFYGKSDKNTLLGCYCDTVKNVEDVLCVNALVNGSPELLPVSTLFNKVCKLKVVLRSGAIKKSKGEWLWSLNVHELKIDDVGKDELGYFRRTEPKIKFFC